MKHEAAPRKVETPAVLPAVDVAQVADADLAVDVAQMADADPVVDVAQAVPVVDVAQAVPAVDVAQVAPAEIVVDVDRDAMKKIQVLSRES